MGMSQMCTGAGDYFRTSKPHSEKLCPAIRSWYYSGYLCFVLLPESTRDSMYKTKSEPPEFVSNG